MPSTLEEILGALPFATAAGPGARLVVFRKGSVVAVPPAEAARAGAAPDPLAAPAPAWGRVGGRRADDARRARLARRRAAQAGGDPFVRRAFDVLLAAGPPAPGGRPEVVPVDEAGSDDDEPIRLWAVTVPGQRYLGQVLNLVMAPTARAAVAEARARRARDARDPVAICSVVGGRRTPLPSAE